MKRKYTTPSGSYYNLFKDMTEQNHLLVAGATGSGKSVVVNGIITTLLYKFPGQVSFILIDPKRVELSPYRDLPHTIKYATEPQEMVSALELAMTITNKRYVEMQKKHERKYSGGDVYVIIDEWADLMTTNRKYVAPLVQRLAQVGRAAKVHVILCTQTPIAKIIPTEIKCNFDSRVGLRTRSKQDSINILGYSGLETFPEYGEGIYMTPKGDVRYNIPYVDEREQNRLIKWWLDQKTKRSFWERIFA